MKDSLMRNYWGFSTLLILENKLNNSNNILFKLLSITVKDSLKKQFIKIKIK